MKPLSLTFVLLVAVPALCAGNRTFGKPLQGLPAVSLELILAHPEAGKLVRLEGEIQQVCQSRGCWLEMKQGSSAVHVTFQGYSFFVPKDAAGLRVTLEGRVLVKEPDPEQVAHKTAEGASAAGGRVSIEATGVEIRELPQ